MRIVQGDREARAALLGPDRRSFEGGPGLQAKLREVFRREMTPEAAVAEIVEEVRRRGDEALIDFTHRFDGVELSRLEVTREEIAQAYRQVDTDLLDALHLATERIRAFHSRLVPQGWLDLAQGLGQMVRPLDRVGLYVPGGGAAYPSTVLMTAIPARVAGVREVIVTTPARGRGEVPPATLVACDLAQVDRVFRVGGPHAIAALAYGTATIPAVDKVCGPGNLLVQLAKKAVFGVVGVDTIQGPSETIVVADDRADPALCAADLLAQAEHGEDARPVLLTTSPRLAERVARRLQTDVRALPEGSPAPRSVERHGLIAVLDSWEEVVELANTYAPEHLCLLVRDPWAVAGRFINAGGVFLGEGSPEVLGDYTAGPSHVMPTGGAARFASPLSVLDFVKVTSVVGLPAETVRAIGPAAVRIAQGEGLPAHARAVQLRLSKDEERDEDSLL